MASGEGNLVKRDPHLIEDAKGQIRASPTVKIMSWLLKFLFELSQVCIEFSAKISAF
jgi:hypothetical protein